MLKLHHDATACHICGKQFTKDKKYRKVREHCHCTKYRDAAHNTYNLRFNVHNEISVVCHNG